MVTYWDTSALLALLFEEVHSARAKAANDQTDYFLAWRWIEVEARLGTGRRNANPIQLDFLDRWLSNAEYANFPEDDYPVLIDLGLRHKLRAADAGHLHSLLQVRRLYPEIVFVCFDEALTAAAKVERVEVWEG